MPYVFVYDPDEPLLKSRMYVLERKLEGAHWPLEGWHRRAAFLRSIATCVAKSGDVVGLIDLAASRDDTRLEGLELVETIARHPVLRFCKATALTHHVNPWVVDEASKSGAAGVMDMQWLQEAPPRDVQKAIRAVHKLVISPRRPSIPCWPPSSELPSPEEADRHFRTRW